MQEGAMASEIVGATAQVSPSTDGRASRAGEAGVWLDTLSGFWTKLNNDWIFNLAGLLAYNLLMALFPLLLLLLAGWLWGRVAGALATR